MIRKFTALLANIIVITLSQAPNAVASDDKENLEYLKALTPHSAEYRVFYGSIELGKARYQLPESDNGYYNYRFDSDISLLMLSDVRNLNSEFKLEDGKVKPIRYMSKRSGTGSDYTEQTAFAAGQGVIHTIYKDEREKLPFAEDIYDPLVSQLIFRMDMYRQPELLKYKMVKEKEFDDYEFKIVGKEQVILDSGTYQTVKIEVVRKSKKRQTFFWMAPELNYLPVRLSHFSKGSKQLDIQLDNYQIQQAIESDTAVTKANAGLTVNQ
ncbi:MULTISPECIES: DUF3108 domain-containing protein [unclassified Shewanella]|uniref:DUF3108 domain-containing protein n=1 Tax=unclassified Shewanella TaxID=196818 RepID=UPI000CC8C51D|nr:MULTISPECIES: DUF3108 domain-containing protein [unclassified Shewanella]MDO6620210.1 DUF3108 domain-containing protein [Shewanella sp. 6_MG-2023]MDO6641549.1 DUF3108 domain-containing protein [Shewanella sp. 5_MG-2023]MDO6679923.1 DUF3108 domain-containing protein [Shewanella sp. 4_MG-2023]MDO6776864.1 DUF3108 domain-containing protein [Shewanella sp. 3_MG-2023]PMG31717.1 hypothetical protein BCU94_07165 [Shewanella sp. 10N.286.52.C2]